MTGWHNGRTRGGLAAALNEIADTAHVQINLEETAVPVIETGRGACEILGLDPLYVANEGRFIAIVPEDHAARALEILRAHSVSAGATRLGGVTTGTAGLVTLRSRIGAARIVDLLSGEQLPRIC